MTEGRPGARQELERLIRAAVPWVHSVDWDLIAPGMGVARLRFRWWAWAFPVIAQAVAERRAREVLDRYEPVGANFLICVW